MSEQVVTKSKNEGRVAAGKRLVEWNRKNKENLVKNKEQVESSDLTRDAGDQQEPQSQTSTVVYGGLAIVVVISVALYVYRKKPAPLTTSAAPPSNNDDIFCMN